MISFSRQVKEEIVFNEFDSCCKKALLLAVLKINGNLSLTSQGMQLQLRTENAKIASKVHKLLKDLYFRGDFKDTLDIWDMQLCEYGQKIIEMRESFIERLNEIIYGIHHSLSGGKENLKIVYLKNCEKENFMEQLKLNRERDIKLKTTSVGPHRDDLGFFFDDMDVRKFGSQGQQRCAALSLKLSEIELVKSVTKDTPILLLDDVLSELDKNRQNYLLNHIHDIQAMITCTGLDEFVNCRFSIDKIFKVTDGTVFSEN